MSYLRDFNMAAFWAGITGFVWYAFGTVPLHIAVSSQLGLTIAQSSSWMFIVWFSGAVSSIALSLRFRQPIPITWTIPGLVYLGTLAGKYSLAEMIGANLMAGVLIIALGLLGVGARIMAWLPLPIVMGMFAGSIMDYITRMVSATVKDAVVAGVTVAAFLIGRALKNPKVPPLGLAMIAGGIVVYLTGTFSAAPIEWALPTVAVPEIAFSFPAFIAISLPMLILAMGLGNVQGLGFLMAQGYNVPINLTTVVVGINSVVNALFGGHAAIVARTGVAIFAAPDAGPHSGRYWANLIGAKSHHPACSRRNTGDVADRRASAGLRHRVGGARRAVGVARRLRESIRWHAAFLGPDRVRRRGDAVLDPGHNVSLLGDHRGADGGAHGGALGPAHALARRHVRETSILVTILAAATRGRMFFFPAISFVSFLVRH